MSEIEKKALEILARIAKKDVAELEPAMDLVGDLGIDSPKALELVCDIEDECGFEVPDDAVGEMETVGDLLTVVRSCVETPLAACGPRPASPCPAGLQSPIQ